MAHWTQTPEGKKRLATKRITSAHLKKMREGHRRYYQTRKTNGTAPAFRRVKTGRELLVELAREGAVLRRAELVRELEKVNLFLAKTGGHK